MVFSIVCSHCNRISGKRVIVYAMKWICLRNKFVKYIIQIGFTNFFLVFSFYVSQSNYQNKNRKYWGLLTSVTLLTCYFFFFGKLTYCYGNLVHSLHFIRKRIFLCLSFILSWAELVCIRRYRHRDDDVSSIKCSSCTNILIRVLPREHVYPLHVYALNTAFLMMVIMWSFPLT